MLDTPTVPRDEIRALGDWIVQEGIYGTHYDTLLEAVCLRLVDAGIPLLRVNFSMRAYHPEVGGFAYRWKRETGMEHFQYARTLAPEDTGWDKSPLKALIESDELELRHRLDPNAEEQPFPMFLELIDQGATDYFAVQVLFRRGKKHWLIDERNAPAGMMISWTCDRPGGFTEHDLNEIRFLLPKMALAMKSNSHFEMAQELLSTYLSRDAASRVLSGDIGRGSVETLPAVILLFDLAGFTKLSETLEGEEVIEMLNGYFGSVVEEIETRGGIVLKFMGDGLLAVFTGGDDPAHTALETVKAIREAMTRVNIEREGEGLPATGCTMGLHSGDVLYGNIGGTNRLDFTVIGSAVNATARMQSMCSMVDQPIVVSDEVARPMLDAFPELVSLGQYRLRGVARRVELFTLD